jgi:hypothetical protein
MTGIRMVRLRKTLIKIGGNPSHIRRIYRLSIQPLEPDALL